MLRYAEDMFNASWHAESCSGSLFVLHPYNGFSEGLATEEQVLSTEHRRWQGNEREE